MKIKSLKKICEMMGVKVVDVCKEKGKFVNIPRYNEITKEAS